MRKQEERTVIPVVREEVSIEKRREETGSVTIEKTVGVETRDIDISLHSDAVEVRREPRNEILEKPLQQWQEGDTLVIPVMEEQLVVTKKIVLKELVYVTRRETTRDARETVELRRENVNVKRTRKR